MIFTDDDGSDGSLIVEYLNINGEALHPTDKGVLFEKNDSDSKPESMKKNSALSFWYSPAPVTIRIEASGQAYEGWPRMLLRIDGRVFLEETIDSEDGKEFVFQVPLQDGNNDFEIEYPEDASDPDGNGDRNLFIKSIKVGEVTYINVGEATYVHSDVFYKDKKYGKFHKPIFNMYWAGTLYFSHNHDAG